MMFLRSVGAVFRGVSAFPEFAKRNPFRALFHLFLFCLLTALLICWIQSVFINRKIDVCTAGLQKHFGRIEVSEAGVLPTKNKNVSWTFYLPGDLRLDYFAPGDKLAGKGMEKWDQRMGILWARRGFLVWMRPDSAGTYYMMPFVHTEAALKMLPSRDAFFQLTDQKTVEAELGRYQEKPDVKGITASQSDFSGIGKTIKIYTYIMLVLWSTFSNFILTLILILMFAALQSLWKAPGLEKLKFGKTVALLCYAAFPALVIRMLLESFGFLNMAEILFYIVFFVYQMIAFHAVRRSIADGGDVNGSEH
ncbi:MAG: hypothetical protein IJW23_10595 [Lentisphaeria bacterium]|nr:hypothetical protein [Lentisphaeria bacterium]